MWKLLLLALALIGPASAAEPSLYDKVAARLAADPQLAARLGKPSAELKALGWMIGAWDVVAMVQAGRAPMHPEHGISVVTPALGGTWFEIRDTYPGGTQDLGFLGFDPAARRWNSIGLDSTGNAIVTTGAGWEENTLVLSGDVTIVGVRTTLRQIVTRLGTNAYTVTNVERRTDGGWRVLDTYRYTRK